MDSANHSCLLSPQSRPRGLYKAAFDLLLQRNHLAGCVIGSEWSSLSRLLPPPLHPLPRLSSLLVYLIASRSYTMSQPSVYPGLETDQAGLRLRTPAAPRSPLASPGTNRVGICGALKSRQRIKRHVERLAWKARCNHWALPACFPVIATALYLSRSNLYSADDPPSRITRVGS